MKKYKFFKISSIVSIAIGLSIVLLYISGESDTSWFNNIFNGLFVKNGSSLTAKDISDMLLLISLISLLFGFIMMLLTYRKYNDAYVAAKHDAAINKHVARTLALKQLQQEEKKKAKIAAKKQRQAIKLERAKRKAEMLAKQLNENTETPVKPQVNTVESQPKMPKVTVTENNNTQTTELLSRIKNGR